MRKLTITFILLISNFIIAQECPSSLYNGDFEELTGIPGATPSLGISKGAIENWFATHGTADYQTPEWDWYGGLGMIQNNAGHLCYGNRPDHKHSEGMYTEVEMIKDKSYTLSFDFGSVCERTESGMIHIFLNNNLAPSAHNFFQFPTEENSPELFSSSQEVNVLELTPSTDLRSNGFSKYEYTFTATQDFTQIWFFTSFEYEGDDSVNCGFMIDNVRVTSDLDELSDIKVTHLSGATYEFSPEFESEVIADSYNWSINEEIISQEESFTHNFNEGNYTICLDMVDSNSSCGKICKQFTLGEDNAVDLCTYSTCLDFGGVPYIGAFEYMNNQGDVISISKDHNDFSFPYCLGSNDFCLRGTNELDLFIHDINNWITKNGMHGQVNIIEGSEAYALGCRSNVLEVIDSELSFLSLIFTDQDENEYVNNFSIQQDRCTTTEELYVQNEEENVLEDYSSIKENAEFLVEIFPNPFVDFVKVSSEKEDITNVEIFNMSGELVFQDTPSEPSQLNYDLSSFEEGMYVVSISSETETETYKLMKN